MAGQGQVDGPKDDGQAAAHTEFVIQLGAFTNPDNAKQLQAKLAQAGIRSYAQTLETGSGSAIRVGVGPFASRDSAEGALARVQKLGLNGSVVQR